MYHSKLNRHAAQICKGCFLILATIISSCSCARPQGVLRPPEVTRDISIIPQPSSITINRGYFEFSRFSKIVATDVAATSAATALNNILKERYGFTLGVTADTGAHNAISFLTDNSQQSQAEAYSLKIEPGSIQLSGTERGMFYGIQSLVQLLPAESTGESKIPAAVIRDAPRFRYRGMHLDVARHFMPVEFIKKYIRLISAYKYNFFHWHLTDDQGWRIEIKKYPLLTAVGSRRPETVVGKNYPTNPKESNRYLGYRGDNIPVHGSYTQDEIREIVNYAKERYVTIVPEIDLPGHSSSALAAYPEYGCRKNYTYKVQTTWGAFPDIYCPTEPTFKFIEDVLSEVIGLFPDSPYIHIGGDEVVFTNQWRNSGHVQELMRTNRFSTNTELLSWFVNRVAQFVKSKQKKIIVWDEIVGVGLPQNAMVMSWAKVQNGAAAARAKHEVVMTPFKETYFDHPQSAGMQEPESIYSKPILLPDVYNFDPTAGLSPEDAEYVIGGQGCLWTEFMKTPRDVEYMMFPRAIALAEALWSKRENKSFRGFSSRLNKEFRNLDREQVNYKGASRDREPTTAAVFQPVLNMPVPERRLPAGPIVSVHEVIQAPSLAGKSLPFRISVPPDYETSNRRFPVLYLLHGVTGNENDWWVRSKLADYAVKYQMIIVTPGVGDSWYANSASDSGARYEDALVCDLIPFIDSHYRTIASREGRAIAGVSMGGFGAMKLALRYPQLFQFAGSLSGPFDAPITASWGKTSNDKMSRDLQLIFGETGSQTRRDNDVFELLNQALNNHAALPYLYVSSGISDQTPQVAQSNMKFAQTLGAKDLRFEYNRRPGTHDWRLWDSEIFLMLGRMCVFMKTICS